MKKNSRNRHLLFATVVTCLSVSAASAQTYPLRFTEVCIDSMYTISDRYEHYYREYPDMSHRRVRHMVLTAFCETGDFRSLGPAVYVHYKIVNDTDKRWVVFTLSSEKSYGIYESHSFRYRGKEYSSEPKRLYFPILSGQKEEENGDEFIEPGEMATGRDKFFFFDGTVFKERLLSIPYSEVHKSYRTNRKMERIARKVFPTVSVKMEIREEHFDDDMTIE